MHLKEVGSFILWQYFFHSVNKILWYDVQMLHLILKGSKFEEKKTNPILILVSGHCWWSTPSQRAEGAEERLLHFPALHPREMLKGAALLLWLPKNLRIFTLMFKWATCVVLLVCSHLGSHCALPACFYGRLTPVSCSFLWCKVRVSWHSCSRVPRAATVWSHSTELSAAFSAVPALVTSFRRKFCPF